MEKLIFGLGPPRHGWLPVSLAAAGLTLDFSASAVPTDPLSELTSALLLVTQQAEAVVTWNLEPGACQFRFSPEPAGRVQLTITAVEPGTATKLPGSLSGSYEAVVLPIWRALQKLNPADFDGVSWPPLPLEKLQKLRALVKARRVATQS